MDWENWDLGIVAVVYIILFAAVGAFTGWHWKLCLGAVVVGAWLVHAGNRAGRQNPGTVAGLGLFLLGVAFVACSVLGALAATVVRALR